MQSCYSFDNPNDLNNRISDKEINDENFSFTLLLPDNSKTEQVILNKDSSSVAYSFLCDTTIGILLLAFKMTAIPNLEDFIYRLEKDLSLDIPQRISSDYDYSDFNSYEYKKAKYQDNFNTYIIYYFRTKLLDAPYNYAYMIKFIVFTKNLNSDIEKRISKIADSFLPTAK